MKKPFLLALIFILATAGIVFYLNMRFPNVLSLRDNKIHLVSSIALLSYFVVVLASRRWALSQALQYMVTWIGIAVVILVGYAYRGEIKEAYDRVTALLIPYRGVQNADGSVEFPQSEGGHYKVEGIINGTSVRFLVDTGASRVVLTQKDARRLGYDPAHLSFNQPTNTANGQVFSAPIRLPSLKIGPITLYDVPGAISGGELNVSLLGMSFLNQLKSWSVEQEKLILRN